MGMNIAISLPPVAGSKCHGSIGDIRYARSMHEDCMDVGIPLDLIEDGWFDWSPTDEQLERVRDAVYVQIRSMESQLECGEGYNARESCPWGLSLYTVSRYLEEWKDLLDTAHELRVRGVEANFFGG